MAGAYGQSGQGGQITIGDIGPLKLPASNCGSPFHNADTTVTDDGWGKLCPCTATGLSSRNAMPIG